MSIQNTFDCLGSKQDDGIQINDSGKLLATL